jgi:hypothetical protein
MMKANMHNYAPRHAVSGGLKVQLNTFSTGIAHTRVAHSYAPKFVGTVPIQQETRLASDFVSTLGGQSNLWPLHGPFTAPAELSQLIIVYCFASVPIVLRSHPFTV